MDTELLKGIEVRESTRAKHARIVVHADGRIVATRPARMYQRTFNRWISARRTWIEETQARMLRAHERFERTHGTAIPLPKLRRGTNVYKEAIAHARSIANARTRYFAKQGSYTYGTISIRNQKSRWGSCSARGNISFNYRLFHLSPELIDYLIVHELAHTKYHNHSKEFWNEVAKYIPDFLHKRRELHRYRF